MRAYQLLCVATLLILPLMAAAIRSARVKQGNAWGMHILKEY